MKSYLTAFLFFVASVHCLAQEDAINKKKYSFMQKHFFWGNSIAIVYDFFNAPESFNTLDIYGNSMGEQKKYNTFALASCAIDLRVNIVDFSERSSCSFNFPVTPSIGIGEVGFGSFYFPFLLQYNYGYHSTFNNIDHKGFTAGAGYMLIMYPLFPENENRYDTRTWGDVVFKAGYKTDSRELKNFDIMVGVLNGFSMRIGFGFIFNY